MISPRLERVTELINRSLNLLGRLLLKLFVGGLFLGSALALLFLIQHYASQFQFDSVGFVALTPLALLIGLSGLTYNRTRAVERKHRRFRSLYAAERLLAACCFYLLAVVIAFIVTVFLQPFAPGMKTAKPDLLFAMYLPSMFFVVLAFFEMLYALLALWPRGFSRHSRPVAKRVRHLL